MKLLFCLYRYFPYGGLQRDALSLANACAQKGHDVTILCGDFQGEMPQNITVKILPARKLSNHGLVKKLTAQFQQYFTTHHYDLVIGFNRIPNVDIYYAADPCYAESFQQLSWYQRYLPRYRYFRQQEQALCSNPQTHFLLLTDKESEKFSEYYHISETRRHVLPLGLNPVQFPLNDYDAKNQMLLKKQFDIAADKKLILFVASHFDTKGLDRALLAITELPLPLQKNIVFFIAGTGNPMTHTCAAEVRFLGGRDDVPDLMRAADVLLHPARSENAGNILIEAMGSGLPIITTDVCGYAPHVLAAGAGEVLPSPFCQTTLNQALLGLLSQDNTQIRKNGIEYCRKQHVHERMEKMVNLIEDLAI